MPSPINDGKLLDGNSLLAIKSYLADNYATSSHTHTLSLATDTGTSSITLASAGKYKLTAGGNSLVFTMPTDNDHYPTTFTWTNGTTSGPTGSLTGNSGFTSVSFGAIPAASSSQSGVVTVGSQSFIGEKTFMNPLKVGDSNLNTITKISAFDLVIGSTNGGTSGLVELDSGGLKFGDGGLYTGDGGYVYLHSGQNDFYFPSQGGTLLINDNVPKYQMAISVVGDATTNINGRVFQNYTATLVTSGGYTFYQILKNGNNPTEAEAKEYMKYMTGSEFLPVYNYDFPKQTLFMFADRSIWKPQYSSADGLRLYRLTTALALESQIPTVNNGTFKVQGSGTDAVSFTANQSGNSTLNIKGSGGTTVTKSASNEITISSTAVNNATLTIQNNGTTVNTFSANASSDVTANIITPQVYRFI